MTGLQNGHDPGRADYDWRRFAAALRTKRGPDPRGFRAIADDIGVTATDMTRALGGQAVSVAKVIAFCRWLEVPVDHFYLEPDFALPPKCFSGDTVKHSDGVRSAS